MSSESTLNSGESGVELGISRIRKICYNEAARRRSSSLGSIASAASVEAAIHAGALRLRDPSSASDALYYDAAPEPGQLTFTATDGLRPPLSFIR